MSLPVAITAIVAADIAIIALLAFVMTRAAKLTPHVAALAPEPRVAPPVASERRDSSRARTRVGDALPAGA
jgi:hypothetical protein